MVCGLISSSQAVSPVFITVSTRRDRLHQCLARYTCTVHSVLESPQKRTSRTLSSVFSWTWSTVSLCEHGWQIYSKLPNYYCISFVHLQRRVAGVKYSSSPYSKVGVLQLTGNVFRPTVSPRLFFCPHYPTTDFSGSQYSQAGFTRGAP